MGNPGMAADDPANGSFALAALANGAKVTTYLRGGSKRQVVGQPDALLGRFLAGWRSSVPRAGQRNRSVALPARATSRPAPTPISLSCWPGTSPTARRLVRLDRSGSGRGKRPSSATATARASPMPGQAAEYAGGQPGRAGKAHPRSFVEAMRETTLARSRARTPPWRNLSTLVTPTCFRTADGEFHGFEGCNDQRGCCFGNCTHVWNYETATQLLFPTLARSLRKAAFGYSDGRAGRHGFPPVLPDGKDRCGFAAADGQMGQIMKLYLDWQLSGDTPGCASMWPRVKQGDRVRLDPRRLGRRPRRRDGGRAAQHLRRRVLRPESAVRHLLSGWRCAPAKRWRAPWATRHLAAEYRRLFESGSKWIDANLFNGEYYIQKIRGIPKDADRHGPYVATMGAADTEHPDFQLGDGCLVIS